MNAESGLGFSSHHPDVSSSSSLALTLPDPPQEEEEELDADPMERSRRAMWGVNVCKCCASDQLSICCSACIKRRNRPTSHAANRINDMEGSNSVMMDYYYSNTNTAKNHHNNKQDNTAHQPQQYPHMSTHTKQQPLQQYKAAKTRQLALRINVLQRSACRCCEAAPSQRTRCCQWCDTMTGLQAIQS